jgi:hypothetical protein
MVEQTNEAHHIGLRARFSNRVQAVFRWLQGFVFGMTYFEMLHSLRRERADREHLFVLISFGDLIGIPILPPYYSLRLLPFVVPLMQNWKRRLLREKDLSDMVSGD